MVNRGASRGCITCKGRHVKCDETKPACNQCIRVGRECAGYAKQAIRVRFRDQTARYLKKTPDNSITADANHHDPERSKTRTCVRQTLRQRQSCLLTHESPFPKQQDMAVAFFLTYVTDVGRNLESTRGYLEFVRPVLALESHESALSAAVNATAIKLWSILRPSTVAASLQIQLHNQALVKLQHAVYSPIEQGKDATVFAALMLQQYDTLAAVFDHNKAHSTHRRGALALLKQTSHSLRSSKYYGHLLGNLFHSKISFCVRHRIPVTESEVDWLHNEVIPALPCNPSFLLDIIGISISRLQSVLAEKRSSHGDSETDALQELPDLIRNVGSQLQSWFDTVPEFWHPSRIPSKSCTATSVATYDGSFDIYPSVQIANIWNTWRIYCLIVEMAVMEFTRVTQDKKGAALDMDDSDTRHDKTIHDLVESICRCIPFYLGNCSQPVSYSDIDNPLLDFPSYHDLPLVDEKFVTYKSSEYYVSKTDHFRHVVLHGPLHALSILSSLIGLLFEGQYSTLAQDLLQKQKQWIDEQFHRSLYLTHFIPGISNKRRQSDHLMSEKHEHGLPPTALAHTTRQALKTVSIL